MDWYETVSNIVTEDERESALVEMGQIERAGKTAEQYELFTWLKARAGWSYKLLRPGRYPDRRYVEYLKNRPNQCCLCDQTGSLIEIPDGPGIMQWAHSQCYREWISQVRKFFA